MPVPNLYPAQQLGVQRFLASGGKYLLAYGTGVGKTPTAIVAMLTYLYRLGKRGGERILVVCPAIVRRHWVSEFERWSGRLACPIEMGRNRRTGTKAALAARDAAYEAPIQIVSYDLLPQVAAQGWDGIIFDEIHHLGDCGSHQSKTARALVHANPTAALLGLSATLIPTRLHQLWHPLHLFWPGDWGRAPRTGSIPWQFVSRWQYIEDNGFGKFPGAAREEKLPELRSLLGQVAHRLTREDIAADLPPLDVKALELPGSGLGRSVVVAGRPRPQVTAVGQWLEALPEDITHAVVLCYHRELAALIAGRAGEVQAGHWRIILLTGASSPASRVAALAEAEQSERVVLVATSEAIREGVRLMWAQRVLFAEWRQSPAQVLQVLGRFQSVGDVRRPSIDVLTDESLREQAGTLLQRVSDINGVLKAGSAEDKVAEVFGPAELSEQRMAELTKAMLADRPTALDPEWAEASEGEDENGW